MRPKNTKTKRAVLNRLAGGEWLTAQEIAADIGDYDLVTHYLRGLLSERAVERRKEMIVRDGRNVGMRYSYHATGIVAYAGAVVTPAYRNLRLAENLVNYDRTNHAFASLCMMVRR
jgi:hypothetical protein